METLVNRIKSEARYLGNGILRVDSFLNHCVDTKLMTEIGQHLAGQLSDAAGSAITKVVTVETGGIPPALTTAQALAVPMLYARKKRPATMMGEVYQIQVRSHTKGNIVDLTIAADYLDVNDNVVLVDDFIGRGDTANAMLDLIRQSGAKLCGIGFVLEKVYENGRQHLGQLSVPVITLAQVDLVNDRFVVSKNTEIIDQPGKYQQANDK